MYQYKLTMILCAFVHFFPFVKFSIGLDTLFLNQKIVTGQTLISQNQIFEMGFFSPGSSNNKFLGIWCKSKPDIVVWVANRVNPITDSKDLSLAIAGNGNLIISTGGGIVWSANSSGSVLNPILRLLDTGNLVLVGKNSESWSKSYIWQSFDYPSDTLLPGMKVINDIDTGIEKYLTSWKSLDDPSPGDFILKIENQGLPDLVLFKKTKKMIRSGWWNRINFTRSPLYLLPILKPVMVFKEERLISMSLPSYNSLVPRLTVDGSGLIKFFVMNVHTHKWHLLTTCPHNLCEEYAKCGPFAICTSGFCQCLKGYVPKFQKDWDLLDWSGGCIRNTPLDCQIADHDFKEITGVKYPDMLHVSLTSSKSMLECRAFCLRNCSCNAYANPYMINGSLSCLMWFGELIDTRYLSMMDDKQNIHIRVLKSELDRNRVINEGMTKRPIILISIAIVSGILVSLFINGITQYLARRIQQETTNEVLELPMYKLSTIMTATNNFSIHNLIGEGGFGPVYKGNFSMAQEIVVKRLSRNSTQGLPKFKNEVTVIAKLQHRNLVKLLGCCIEQEERILIYEYMQNKSFDTFVFDENRRTLLAWPERFNIVMGIARGLLYLHHDSRFKVIHRDLKTSNILLDANLNPKISNFGLARTFEENQSSARTKRVVRTYGYMSPEYVIAGTFSMKSDIFSLGVVLLEIVSGKKNQGSHNICQYHSLLEWAWLLWKENKSLELMDECLNCTFIESQVKRCIQVGLLCVQKYAEDRPEMISVYSMLVL